MLQNLANKPLYAKEEYMRTLHPFVEGNKPRIEQFLNDLCEVGDFFETLEVRRSISTALFACSLLSADGPIHGSVEEGRGNQHYSERAVQHTFTSSATH
jgi:hypothetical protein